MYPSSYGTKDDMYRSRFKHLPNDYRAVTQMVRDGVNEGLQMII
jgi:hypothetical protein